MTTSTQPQTLRQILKTIADKLANPMPDWAFCAKCGHLLINVPGVRQMIADRIGEGRVTEAPTCQCETDTQIAIRRLYIRSGVPHQMPNDRQRTLENFISREGSDSAHALAKGFITNDLPIATLVGATGTGKTHLAEAVCREFLSAGTFARYEFVPALLDAMRGVSGEEVSSRMDVCVEAKVLVLDDLGAEKSSDWTNERLTSIVEQRLGRHAKTFITTNLTMNMLAQKGYERLASRMWAFGTGDASVAYLECSDARVNGV